MKIKILKLLKALPVLIVLALFATSMHTYIHVPYDHNHDQSCSVYVLEQLYATADIVAPFLLPIIFIAFQKIKLPQQRIVCECITPNQARAPPKPLLS